MRESERRARAVIPSYEPARAAYEHDARRITEDAADVLVWWEETSSGYASIAYDGRSVMRTIDIHAVPWLVAGIVEMGADFVLLRIHAVGTAPAAGWPHIEERMAMIIGHDEDLADWRPVVFDHEEARCIEHDECEASAEMGALCFRARRGERT